MFSATLGYTRSFRKTNLLKTFQRTIFFDRKVKGFDELPLHNKFLKKLSTTKFKVPSSIQVESLEPLMTKKDTLIVAPTGSGKTMAYLLPVSVVVAKTKFGLFSHNSKSAMFSSKFTQFEHVLLS